MVQHHPSETSGVRASARRFVPPAAAAVSLGLGAVQVAVPGRFARLVGAGDSPAARTLVRAVGVRELACGLALVSADRPRPWLWARAVGDALDAVVLGRLALQRDERSRRAALAAAAAAGFCAADSAAAMIAPRSLELSAVVDQRGATIVPITAARSWSRSRGEQRMEQVRTAVTINRPVDEVYRAWRDFSRLPTYMHHLESVDVRDDQVTRWTVRGPLGRKVSWEAELVRDTPAAIEWRSLRGPVETRGAVRFRSAPAGRGTEVHVEAEYAAPAGAVGRALARLSGEAPAQQVADDVRRFKQVLETGEVARSEGSPDGTVAIRQALQRPAQPVEPAGT